MILLLYQIFIYLSSSKLIENDKEIEKMAKENENNFETENEDDLQGIPPSIANDHEIHEAWIRKKFEIHQKIAQLEALHHEEEIDEEDDEHMEKIEKILEGLNKKKFYLEYQKKKEAQSLEEIQNEEETSDPEQKNNFLNNLQHFNDDAKSLYNEIMKDSKNQKSNNLENKQEKNANNKQQTRIQNKNTDKNNNDLPTSNNVNLELEQPTIPITSSQEVTKTIDAPEIDEKGNSNKIFATNSKLNIKFLLVPFIILAAIIIFVFKIFNHQIKRWLRHKRSDELPNSLKYC